MNAAAAMQKYNEDAYKNWDENVLEPCKHCGRTFRPEAFAHHKKACTAEKPMKRPGQKEESKHHLGLAARSPMRGGRKSPEEEERPIKRPGPKNQYQ